MNSSVSLIRVDGTTSTLLIAGEYFVVCVGRVKGQILLRFCNISQHLYQ
jgi:hypothetical protein